jgi:hypothetical protein
MFICRKCFGLFFCILLVEINGLAWGQTVITGELSSTDGERLSGISVLVQNEKNVSGILTYSISDKDGKFKLEFTTPSDSIFLLFKSLSFKDSIIGLGNKSRHCSVVLPPDVFSIKEVNVKGYPISVKGDTLNYIVNSFAKANDRSIGDVISRMPGFEVDELGKISFQGQPIQKYYIEGLDLLEKRYTLANRNLPHTSVASVEVLQKHQPIKMLEDRIASDGTSINIKLKNDVAITGAMSAGAGYSPFLREVNFTPMLFHKRQQIIASAQSNNTGDDLNAQHQPLLFEGGEFSGYKNRKPDILGVSQVTEPEIEKQRYLDNDAYLLSYNHLRKLNKGTELKINSSFYTDRLKQDGDVYTQYFLDDGDVAFTEITQNTFLNKSLSTDLVLTQNEKSKYLTNKFSINKFWDSEKGVISDDADLTQEAETPHFSLTNDLDVLLPVKRNFIRFYSFIDYNNSPQQLSFSPGVLEDVLNRGEDYSLTTQNIMERNVLTHHFLQFSLGKKPWIFETEPGIEYEHQQLQTDIEKDGTLIEADSMRNNLEWDFTGLYLKETIKYEKNNLWLSVGLPVYNQNYNIGDQFHDSPEQIQKLLFTPSANFRFELKGFWMWRASVKYNKQLGEVSSLTQGYVFSSYRLLKQGINQLSEKNSLRYSLSMEYKNPFSGFFSNFVWLSVRGNNNLLLDQQIDSNGLLFYDVIEKENHSYMDNFTLKVNQYFTRLQATIDCKAFYTRNKKEYLLNEQLGWYTSNIVVVNPGISINRWRKFDVEYSYKLQWLEQNTDQAKITVNEQKHKGSILYTPAKCHLVTFNFEYYQTKQSNQDDSNVMFADFSYYLKPSKGKLKYKFEVSNLFNHSEIVRYYNSTISLTKSRYYIRPRQFLVTVSLGL